MTNFIPSAVFIPQKTKTKTKKRQIQRQKYESDEEEVIVDELYPE